MNENIYQAPEAKLTDIEHDTDAYFFVVSVAKLIIMMIGSVGLYGIYWFYKNWKSYKFRHEVSLWPIPRAIFSIFFAHSLFYKIDTALNDNNVEYDWSPGGLATAYVIFSLCSSVFDQLSYREIGLPYVDYLSALALFVICYCLVQVQKAVNIFNGDVEGSTNNKITFGNVVLLVVGLLIWGLVIVDMFFRDWLL